MMLLLLSGVVLISGGEAVAYSGGTGMSADPYLLGTPEDWTALSATEADWDKYFILITDIDFSGALLVPIGNSHGTVFTGVFDGKGHKLRNGQIILSSSDGVGLFGFLGLGGEIRNLGVEVVTVAGQDGVGGLLGYNQGTVESCYTTGTVTGRNEVGGLVGGNTGTIISCCVTGAVTGVQYVGGLTGSNGLPDGVIASCYATGAVTGDSVVGGLIGINMDEVASCYAAGAVTGTTTVGGLVGYHDGVVEGCYWDMEATGQSLSSGGGGRTTDDMTYPYADDTYVDWDFESVWMADVLGYINNGYPFLIGNVPSPPHPADVNKDFRMIMSEAIAYLAGWQQGSNPMAYAIRAAYLWQNGEYYVYYPEILPPLCWEVLSSVEGEDEGEGETEGEGEFEGENEDEGEPPVEGEVVQFTLRYVSGEHGWISGPWLQTVNQGGDGVPVTAEPDPGYYFTQWSDGLLTATREDRNISADLTVFAMFDPSSPRITSFLINGGAVSTAIPVVTLDIACTTSPTEYMASELPDFVGAEWQPYTSPISFTFSGSAITREVYFRVRTEMGESEIESDTIYFSPATGLVANGTFIMGCRDDGDDGIYGESEERPRHDVTLGFYEIGIGEVTTRQYCDVLNWALEKGYLRDSNGFGEWEPPDDIYVGVWPMQEPIVAFSSVYCNIHYANGKFSPKMRQGLPGSTAYSMAEHPMLCVSWYGAVAFCNWLSQMEGLVPCYNDQLLGNWTLDMAPPAPRGYRLPTEAEWERAAAWDGSKHWVYGFTSDTLTGKDRCNYYDSNPDHVNPLGLISFPYTSPTGWFSGVCVNPNGTIITVESLSPVGAFDMSGNAMEWCHDWYSPTYYEGGTMTNPTGPADGSARVFRGGGWNSTPEFCRSASRPYADPEYMSHLLGFRLAKSAPALDVTSFSINNGDAVTSSLTVTLNNTCTNGPTEYMASESAQFSDATWQSYDPAPTFMLSSGGGARKVYFKVRNGVGESNVVSDSIDLVEPMMITVLEGTFQMGRPYTDTGESCELPVHSVALDAYQIGKYEVTNQQYCHVLNWAYEQGYVYDEAVEPPPEGEGEEEAEGESETLLTLYAGGSSARYPIVDLASPECSIEYSDGMFVPKSRTGLPGGTVYSMAEHPMVEVSWYGAAAYCNWLSQMLELTPCYDMNTGLWPLTVAPPIPGGYRLPTEAEWERAAAWDGSRHWRYGINRDTIDISWANYYADGNDANPLGLTTIPYTSPAGWFNGSNVSPNGNITTMDSMSPVGAYDMSGNVYEWCHDWFSCDYYSGGPMTNPTGPASGLDRVHRSGYWHSPEGNCRSANRLNSIPSGHTSGIGFRVARSVPSLTGPLR